MRDEPQVPMRVQPDQPIDVLTRPVGTNMTVLPEDAEGPSVSLAQLWGYRWSMLLVFLLIAGAALPAIWMNVVPEFRGEALIEVKPTQQVLVYRTPEIGYGSYWSFLSTQVGIITSPEILKRVVAREDVQSTHWYRNPKTSLMGKLRGPPAPYERLRDMLEVRPDGDSQLILIATMTEVATEAPLICNAVTEEYLAFIEKQDFEAGERNLKNLRAKEAQLKEELRDLKARAAALAAKLGVNKPEQLVVQQRLKLDQLEADVKSKRVEIEAAELKLVAMRERGEGTAMIEQQISPGYEADAAWRGYEADVRKAQNELTAGRQRYGRSNPQIAILEGRLAAAKQRLEDHEAYLDAHPKAVIAPPAPRRGESQDVAMTRMTAAELETFVQNLKSDLQPMFSQLEKDRLAFAADFEMAQKLTSLNDDIEHASSNYNDVRGALTQRETERDAPDRITLAAPAIVPARAFKDARVKLSMASVAGGLVAAFALAFIRVRMNTSIENFSDVAELRPVPKLGHLSPANGAPKKTEDAISQLDQIRMLRTTLLRKLNLERGAVIQITSAGPRSGKTSTSVALAKSLRDCGRKVMLVDTDFRNPSVAPRLETPNEPGLMELLRGQASEDEVLRVVDGITVVPAGAQNGVQAADMLANMGLMECFDRWRQDFEVIILDGAPLLASADAAIVAPQIDGSVFVVREKHCRRDEVLSALERIESAGGELLGLIVIGKQRLHQYGYPAYGQKG